ncbi:TolC family protein [Geobacter sp. DSM 9736]|uniref:TolC family protein n=1 Tax=Geobacter sp. DSM 9736 TaxID=1277350 RepID=UPI000B508BB6|nr:TolC family protein [Geobacter sp. DSM 9736]SNB47395.1 Outer membrane protein TolC [Geobacter sp. DSM 9736]
MRQLLLAIFITLLVIISGRSSYAEEAGGEELQRLVAAALANNPEITVSEARWKMFTSRVAQAKSLEDPMLMLKIQNGIVRDPFNFSRDPMTQKVIGISQQLPFWGKRDLKAEVAAKEAESYRWQVEERKLELARMVKETYWQIYFIDRSLQVTEKNLRIMDDFIALAETRYSVGQGGQQDVLKAQVEKSKMLDMKISQEQQRKSLVAALNTLIARAADTPVGRIADPALNPVELTAGDLNRLAAEKRPQFRSLAAQIEKGRAVHRLAEKESYPDVNLSLEYMQRNPSMEDEGLDMYSAGITINLPVFRERRQAMRAESTSEVSMAAAELRTLENSVGGGIADLLAQLERRRKLAELYRAGIIPQAEQALESSVIGYRVGKADVLMLLDSRVTLFNYEREYYDSVADYQMKLAQLEALVGQELDPEKQ